MGLATTDIGYTQMDFTNAQLVCFTLFETSIATCEPIQRLKTPVEPDCDM